jgi:hypothetical protein
MAEKIDPKKFNEDPKFETERNDFDALLEGSFRRLEKKRKDQNPPADENFFDGLFKNLFGG